MVKKTYVFALLATALIVAPTAAFADDQGTRQEINQDAAAVGRGSQVNQRANQRSIQTQTGQNSLYGNCRPGSQSQRSDQLINQSGVAVDGGRVDQNANQESLQRQILSRMCY
ncbi:MAG: hypothetical protein HXY43_06500 [Fischerella sp.]|jgi:hypothetical protein|uniref:hypothetical protein n=1 Tax=Fischerella sp. TaxID=1191 RepID=UPI0017D86286|nr:hypothetical protein [Fischerella sp.]NWF58953.1 hypothetical protein [Fischerella sp.]